MKEVGRAEQGLPGSQVDARLVTCETMADLFTQTELANERARKSEKTS